MVVTQISFPPPMPYLSGGSSSDSVNIVAAARRGGGGARQPRLGAHVDKDAGAAWTSM